MGKGHSRPASRSRLWECGGVIKRYARTKSGSGFYALRFCAVKETIPMKCGSLAPVIGAWRRLWPHGGGGGAVGEAWSPGSKSPEATSGMTDSLLFSAPRPQPACRSLALSCGASPSFPAASCCARLVLVGHHGTPALLLQMDQGQRGLHTPALESWSGRRRVWPKPEPTPSTMPAASGPCSAEGPVSCGAAPGTETWPWCLTRVTLSTAQPHPRVCPLPHTLHHPSAVVSSLVHRPPPPTPQSCCKDHLLPRFLLLSFASCPPSFWNP